jgi:nucleotide-binding universal stress UspA family protein
VLHQAEVLAGRHGVTAELREVIHSRPGRVIRAMSTRGVDLVIVGANLRQDSARFLGPRTSAVIREVRVPILLIAR